MLATEQDELKAEVDRHLTDGTTSMAPGERPTPVSDYTDQQRFAVELKVLRTSPVAVAHVSELPESGSFVARDLVGLSVIVVRQAGGDVRVLVNMCRHRGSQVTEESQGCARRFTCPYHGWSYRPSGELVGVPNADGFPDLDRRSHGLIELPCQERHGFVWAVATPGFPIDVAEFLGPLDAELAGWEFGDYVLERRGAVAEATNWKLLVDAFLENYHVRFLHAATLSPYLHSNLGPFKAFGRHGRMANVRMRYDGLGRPRDERFLHGVSGAYLIQPNMVILWQGTHVEWFTISPTSASIGAAGCEIRLLVPAADAELTERWDKNWDILVKIITEEDFPMARTTYANMVGGLVDQVVFGRNEPFLQHFHDQLDRAVEAGGA